MKQYILASISLLFCGCHFLSHAAKPSIAHPASSPIAAITSVETGAKIQQSGDAVVPAHADTHKEEIKFTIPKGSELTWDSIRKEFRLMISQDSPAQATNLTESLTAPKSFAPETPLAIAQAESFPLYVKVGIALALLGGLLLWSGHYMAGGILIGGGLSLPIVGRALLAFQFPPWLWPCALFLGLAGGLVLGWYVLSKRFPSITSEVSKKAKTLLSKVEGKTELELKKVQSTL